MVSGLQSVVVADNKSAALRAAIKEEGGGSHRGSRSRRGRESSACSSRSAPAACGLLHERRPPIGNSESEPDCVYTADEAPSLADERHRRSGAQHDASQSSKFGQWGVQQPGAGQGTTVYSSWMGGCEGTQGPLSFRGGSAPPPTPPPTPPPVAPLWLWLVRPPAPGPVPAPPVVAPCKSCKGFGAKGRGASRLVPTANADQ